jgi:hypothetical protein
VTINWTLVAQIAGPKNTGRRAATNVRVSHFVLPDFQVYPPVLYRVEELPNGGHDIVFPSLVSNEQVSISYLYFPPLLWHQIHIGTKSDEGLARTINILPTPQLPRWAQLILLGLIGIGCLSVVYIIVDGSIGLFS